MLISLGEKERGTRSEERGEKNPRSFSWITAALKGNLSVVVLRGELPVDISQIAQPLPDLLLLILIKYRCIGFILI